MTNQNGFVLFLNLANLASLIKINNNIQMKTLKKLSYYKLQCLRLFAGKHRYPWNGKIILQHSSNYMKEG